MAYHSYGNREEGFAIELNVVTYDTVYSGLSLWFQNDHIGDLDEPMFLASALGSLYTLRRRPSDCPGIIFDNWDQFPGFEAMRDRGGWSWTSSFDRIEYIYFAIRDSECICFQWRQPSAPFDEVSERHAKVISHEIPFTIYDKVVGLLQESVKKWVGN